MDSEPDYQLVIVDVPGVDIAASVDDERLVVVDKIVVGITPADSKCCTC